MYLYENNSKKSQKAVKIWGDHGVRLEIMIIKKQIEHPAIQPGRRGE
jgi:hypothetical protein